METYNPLLGPVIALVAWSLFMVIWMAIVRFRGFKHHKIDIRTRDGGRGADLDGKVEPQFQWPAHNYNHLMEQPTVFYAVVVALILMDDHLALNLTLAWIYVALRIVHSIWQATVNKVPVRFTLFALSNLCLIALTIHAAMRYLHG
jgi:hypothetical protein